MHAVAPVSGWNVACAHSSQVDVPFALVKLPALHRAHTERPRLETCRPTVHGSQLILPDSGCA